MHMVASLLAAIQCMSILVPRPCAFVACSTKSAQNSVLQATNAQGLGTRLVYEHVQTMMEPLPV